MSNVTCACTANMTCVTLAAFYFVPLSLTYTLPTGMFATGPALASLIFNEAASAMYEHAHSDGGDEADERTCYGQACYKASFLSVGILCFLAAALCLYRKRF